MSDNSFTLFTVPPAVAEASQGRYVCLINSPTGKRWISNNSLVDLSRAVGDDTTY